MGTFKIPKDGKEAVLHYRDVVESRFGIDFSLEDCRLALIDMIRHRCATRYQRSFAHCSTAELYRCVQVLERMIEDGKIK